MYDEMDDSIFKVKIRCSPREERDKENSFSFLLRDAQKDYHGKKMKNLGYLDKVSLPELENEEDDE